VKTKKASRKELGYQGLLGGDWDWPEEDSDTDMEVLVQTAKQDEPRPRSEGKWKKNLPVVNLGCAHQPSSLFSLQGTRFDGILRLRIFSDEF